MNYAAPDARATAKSCAELDLNGVLQDRHEAFDESSTVSLARSQGVKQCVRTRSPDRGSGNDTSIRHNQFTAFSVDLFRCSRMLAARY